MEGAEIEMKGCKFPRISNGRGGSCSKIGQKNGEEQHPDDEGDGEIKWGGGFGRFCGWPSSRIVRVSRASGGKDRHSKVLTTKGLRDRRVRLSVTTAIQFYDLQDRLGYDQPSKAVEWLLKAAAKSIDELPSINASFPDTPKQPSDKKIRSSAEVELGSDSNYHHQQQQQQPELHVSLSKSACSSNSETSKGSGLSLSRSESRIKARTRARERRAEKEKEKDYSPNANSISQSSFTELLSCGLNNVNNSNNTNPNRSTPPIDYIAPGLVAQNHHSSGFSGQIHLGNCLPQSMMMMNLDQHPEIQHFSFVPDHLIPVASGGGGDYNNLSFAISSGLFAGLNRGTLQSNSPSQLLPHLLQRPSPIDGSNILPFFLESAAPNAAPVEENHHHHHQFPGGLDGRFNSGNQTRKGKERTS